MDRFLSRVARSRATKGVLPKKRGLSRDFDEKGVWHIRLQMLKGKNRHLGRFFFRLGDGERCVTLRDPFGVEASRSPQVTLLAPVGGCFF